MRFPSMLLKPQPRIKNLNQGLWAAIIHDAFRHCRVRFCWTTFLETAVYTGSDLNNIFRKKSLKIDLIYLSIHAFTPGILFLFGLRIIHSVGGE